MARKFEELPIYTNATEFTDAVIAILQRPGLRRDFDLRKQIDKANDSILSNMEEGFELSSDDDFARFLRYAKGSLAEVISRLRRAHAKGYIDPADLSQFEAMAEPLGKMMGGFIRYLRTCGFKHRGHCRTNGRRP